MTKILVIPDAQVRFGDNLDFLTAIGNYIVAKQPDKIVCIGDFADMKSLSSYDVGKKSFEGQRYLKDIAGAQGGMAALLTPLINYNENQIKNKHKIYRPEQHLTLGNHEHRITRAVDNDAKLEGILSTKDLNYEGFGWKVYPFLDVVVIDGVAFSHYFVTGVAGRPASSALVQFRRANMSCVAGHQQGLQIHMGQRADGKQLTSIIAGSCYEHDEDYLGPQGNEHWRGVVMLHDVKDGQFDHMPVSLKFLKQKYL